MIKQAKFRDDLLDTSLLNKLKSIFSKENTDVYKTLSQCDGVLGEWGQVLSEFYYLNEKDEKVFVSNILFPKYGEITSVPVNYLETKIIDDGE